MLRKILRFGAIWAVANILFESFPKLMGFIILAPLCGLAFGGFAWGLAGLAGFVGYEAFVPFVVAATIIAMILIAKDAVS